MDMIKSSEFSRSGPFQARRSRYKLPALQILMLQQYPGDCPQARRDLKSPHSESNVQYNEQWICGMIRAPANFQTISCLVVFHLVKTMDAFDILEIFTCQDLFTCFLFFFFCSLLLLFAHHIDTQDFRWRDKYEMLKV